MILSKKIKTQYVNDEYYNFANEKSKAYINDLYVKDGDELIFCKANDNFDTIIYNKANNKLEFNVESESGYAGGSITTDDLTDETLAYIIYALSEILNKRTDK